jgi:sugar-specific transcriptional regulator TrmB
VKRGTQVSLERVVKALIHLGLSQRDAEIYIHLAAKGPQKARNITVALGLGKGNIYRRLGHLRSLGLVYSSVDRAAEFSAVGFEKAIDLYQKRRKNEANFLEKQKIQILSKWKSLSVKDL